MIDRDVEEFSGVLIIDDPIYTMSSEEQEALKKNRNKRWRNLLLPRISTENPPITIILSKVVDACK